MVENLAKNLYRIIIPLPNSPLKDLNSYVIKGGDRNLIIDTGFNRTVCYEAMQQGLNELAIDLNRTDFMLTHMHADHTGLVERLATDSSRIFFSRIDSQVFDEENSWQPLIDFAEINGFPADELQRALHSHPGFKYSPARKPVFTLIEDGDIIECGDYRLRCIATPGHTQGHICLYEERKKLFFTGDHILFDITPHIESWAYTTNSLADYMDSLDKVYNLEVDMVLPGHRNFLGDLKSRIDELKAHHRDRADEVLDVLGDKTMNGYEIAAGMTWDIDCERWEDFPIAQKWFATGEAIAHLRYLESEGRIHRDTSGKIVTFRSVNGRQTG
ncbi:MAG: MBL fold metallo-hydrolase [Smithella sp.]|jgi:glyoxylase-like metal-dependent hydrolase (beta-lactamase superfamily II)|nr:MBL fold metallo-hydrolase [Smithella sp.]